MTKNLMDMTLAEVDADPALQQEAAAILLAAIRPPAGPHGAATSRVTDPPGERDQ